LWERPEWRYPSWYFEPPPAELVELASSSLAPSGPSLDVGCGAGVATSFLAQTGSPSVGVDLVASALVQARRIAGSRGARPMLVQAEAPWLPLRSGAFALVFDRGCFQNIPRDHWGRYFGEMHRLLMPGGVMMLCITSPVKPRLRVPSWQGVRRRLGWMVSRGGPHYASPAVLRRLGGPRFEVVRLDELPFEPRTGPPFTMTLALFRRR
jgi:SAM-dependent methyltransferase